MAKRKSIQKNTRRRTNVRRAKTLNYLRRGEFWIGVATVLVFIGIAVRLPMASLFNEAKSYRVQIIKVTQPPIKKDIAVAKPKVNVIKTGTVNNPHKYIVTENDSYFTATEKVCKDGRFYEFNQQLNQGAALQPGESIFIRCDWEAALSE